MNRVAACAFGRLDDVVYIQIALRSPGPSDTDGAAGDNPVESLTVGRRINADRFDGAVQTFPYDAHCDFSPICN